jgi:hypothetical protein
LTSKIKADGPPAHLIKAIKEHLKVDARGYHVSRRARGRQLAELITRLAATGIHSDIVEQQLPYHLQLAFYRERKKLRESAPGCA